MAPYHELLEVKWKTGDQDKFKFASNAPITSDSGGVKIGLGDVTEYAQLLSKRYKLSDQSRPVLPRTESRLLTCSDNCLRIYLSEQLSRAARPAVTLMTARRTDPSRVDRVTSVRMSIWARPMSQTITCVDYLNQSNRVIVRLTSAHILPTHPASRY
ncbi:hypothetical protein PCANC_01886 [Puccinia coronata f. sp. avenae]|uniref:Uncharacterized protein n=1 Tax=Puccinia coronata f. sp. avenae TaxID=200324 RepID=A0A2N5W4H8_9BASI|nr:hypothetical protein PCANC_01886 [Puccinia coronata f. sp. avenae]